MKEIHITTVPNGAKFRISLSGKIDWNHIAQVVSAWQVKTKPAVEGTAEGVQKIFAMVFQMFAKGSVEGVFVTTWERDGGDFVVTSTI